MKKKKMSQTNKRILYALLSGTLFWHAPFVIYAAEEPAANEEKAAEEQAIVGETSNSNDFILEGVEVTADREHQLNKLPPAYTGGQVARGGGLGILGNKDLMDTPFNITSYTEQTIEDQQARTVADVLMNDPSVRFTTSSGHMNENYTIRGFGVTGWELGFNGMYGLAPYGHTPIEFIERVEVLKGPSALLNGMPPSGAVGGSINLVPKRADDQPLTRITTDYTSDSNFGGHLDLGRRFGKNKEWGVRFNGVYRDGETGVDDQSKKSVLGALGLDYRGNRWRASLDAYNTEENSTNGSPLMVNFKSTVTSIPKAPDAGTNAFRGTFAKEENKGIVARGDYDITKNLTAYASLGTLHYDYAGFINSTHMLSVDALGNSGTTQSTYIKGYSDTISAETGLRSHFKTGTVDHQVVLSATSLKIDSGTNNTQVAYTSNIYHPTSHVLATEPAYVLQTEDTTLSGIALADTLSFEQDKYQLTLGVRNQRVQSKTYNNKTGALLTDYDKSAVTPAIALVVKPWNAPVSLYANYIEGLSKGAAYTDSAGNVSTFAPYKSKQMEAGVKWDAGNFANTLSVFQITKPSVIMVTNPDASYTYNEDGEQRNRGIEWNVFGNVAPHLRLLGGTAFTRGVQTHTVNGTNDGKTAYGTPKWQTNLGFEWDTPGTPGLTLTARAVYTSSQYANSANTQEIPSWIRYDVGARYATKVKGQSVTYRASVENILNKSYWSGTFNDGYITLGSGRTFKLSATIDI
jgi:iron complex outermembrane receptor protein